MTARRMSGFVLRDGAWTELSFRPHADRLAGLSLERLRCELVETLLGSLATALGASLAIAQWYGPDGPGARLQVCIHPDTGDPDPPVDLDELPNLQRALTRLRPTVVPLERGPDEAITSDLDLGALVAMTLFDASRRTGSLVVALPPGRQPTDAELHLVHQLGARLGRLGNVLDAYDAAQTDPVTGLPARTFGEFQFGGDVLSRAPRPLSLVRVGCRPEAPPNDHDAKRIAARLIRLAQDDGLVWREGPDFLVHLPGRIPSVVDAAVEQVRGDLLGCDASAAILHVAAPEYPSTRAYADATLILLDECRALAQSGLQSTTWTEYSARPPEKRGIKATSPMPAGAFTVPKF